MAWAAGRSWESHSRRLSILNLRQSQKWELIVTLAPTVQLPPLSHIRANARYQIFLRGEKMAVGV